MSLSDDKAFNNALFIAAGIQHIFILYFVLTSQICISSISVYLIIMILDIILTAIKQNQNEDIILITTIGAAIKQTNISYMPFS